MRYFVLTELKTQLKNLCNTVGKVAVQVRHCSRPLPDVQVLDGPNCSDTIDVLPSTFFLSVAKAQSDAAHGCLACSMQMTNFGSPTVASYYVALHSQRML